MISYKSTTQCDYYNFSTTPRLQADDTIASSSPAVACAANADDEEERVKEREKIGKGYRGVCMHERQLRFLNQRKKLTSEI